MVRKDFSKEVTDGDLKHEQQQGRRRVKSKAGGAAGRKTWGLEQRKGG